MDYSTNSGSGFSPTLTTLAQMIGSDLASGQKNGYNFTYKVGEQYKGQYVSYTLNADPAIPGSTGLRHFYMDASGVLRVNDSTSAGPSDPELK